MTNSILLDTYIALWLESGDKRLQPDTLRFIEDSWQQGNTILLSAVSVSEIAQPIDRGRIELLRPVEDWVERFIDRPGVDVLPLSHRSAARAYLLDGLEHADSADRC